MLSYAIFTAKPQVIMCGRFALYSNPLTLSETFDAEIQTDLVPRYNIAPSQMIPVVRIKNDETKHIDLARWGLIPHWAKDSKIGYSTFNARAETVTDKPAFRNAYRNRRCLIPANGYYEWQAIAGSKTKQPWYVRLQSDEPMAFAGLWEIWRNPGNGETIESCTIIVTDANELMLPIHDRMPVILAPEDWDNWLKSTPANPVAIKKLLRPFQTSAMKAWPVNTLVNNPRNDSIESMEAIG